MSEHLRWRRYAVSALVASATIAVIPSQGASASPVRPISGAASAAKPKNKPAELIFYADKVVNTRPAHIKPGDSWVTYLTLYDAKKKKTGDGSGRCSAVQATPQGVIAQCTRVLRTKRGQIVLLGMDDRPGVPPWTSLAAILGGTDHYAGMTGVAQIEITEQQVVFKIRPIG